MSYIEQEHNGICAFCKTNVIRDAAICTGCGARWGTKYGVPIAESKRQGKKLMASILMPAIIICILGFFAYFKESLLWLIIFLIISIFLLMYSAGNFISGFVTFMSARKDGYQWRRKIDN